MAPHTSWHILYQSVIVFGDFLVRITAVVIDISMTKKILVLKFHAGSACSLTCCLCPYNEKIGFLYEQKVKFDTPFKDNEVQASIVYLCHAYVFAA